MRLTGTRILTALPLLMLSPESAYTFDKARFSGNDPRPFDARQLSASQNASNPKDDFVLGSSGTISKWDDTQGMNISRLQVTTNALANRATVGHSENTAISQNMNTAYSDVAGSGALVAECGPSPLTPSEIEKLVGTTAEAYGVDPGFAKAITWTESRFDQIRNSPKGARGPMQLMPDTALGLGVRDACDPASNIDGGVRHLRALIDEFKNPLVVAAAYNAGSRAVYDSGGIPPYGETIRYVAAVINRQLGLQVLAPARGGDEAISTNKAPVSDERTSDVIGARGSHFVNGVMHF